MSQSAMAALYGPPRPQRWALVAEDGTVTPQPMPADWQPVAYRIMGNDNGLDSAGLTRHYHAFVDQWGLTNGRPRTFMACRPIGTGAHREVRWGGTPLHGPVLVYRVNDIGDTIDMTDMDIASLAAYVRRSRAGVVEDIRVLERNA